MRHSSIPFWSTLMGLTIATNTSIHFFSDSTGCINNWFGCGNLPIGWCCASSNPYCRWVTCDDCHAQGVPSYQLLTHNTGDCSGDTSDDPPCTATTIDNCCTVDSMANSNPDKCSAMVVPSGGREQCLGKMEPDTFGFMHNGTSHEVHLPTGTYQQAVSFAVTSDYDGLLHFLATQK